MEPSCRKKHGSAPQTPAFTSSRFAGPSERETDPPKPQFHLDLWVGFTVQSWALDVGRCVVMFVFSVDSCATNGLGLAEFLHLLYVVTLPLVLFRMLERSLRSPPLVVAHLAVIVVVLGNSLHLVADSVTRRLLPIGYQLHLSVRENPVTATLRPPALVHVFELLFYYGNTLGHVMRHFPLFLIHLLFFSGCFCHRTQQKPMTPAAWTLLAPNVAYYGYLIAEGQTFILFIFTCFAMAATVMRQRRRGMVPDTNGLFMLYSFLGALLLLVVWVVCLWNQPVLRKNHHGLIYVPQPREVLVLYLHQREADPSQRPV